MAAATLVIVEIVVFDGEEEQVVRALEGMAGVLSVKRLDQDVDNGFPYPEGTPEHAAAYGEPDDEHDTSPCRCIEPIDGLIAAGDGFCLRCGHRIGAES